MMDCRKCTYFEKKKNLMNGGTVIVGYCKLRKKHISDSSITNQLCKDKAVVEVDESKLKKHDELRLQDLSSKAWMNKNIESENGEITA